MDSRQWRVDNAANNFPEPTFLVLGKRPGARFPTIRGSLILPLVPASPLLLSVVLCVPHGPVCLTLPASSSLLHLHLCVTHQRHLQPPLCSSTLQGEATLSFWLVTSQSPARTDLLVPTPRCHSCVSSDGTMFAARPLSFKGPQTGSLSSSPVLHSIALPDKGQPVPCHLPTPCISRKPLGRCHWLVLTPFKSNFSISLSLWGSKRR